MDTKVSKNKTGIYISFMAGETMAYTVFAESRKAIAADITAETAVLPGQKRDEQLDATIKLIKEKLGDKYAVINYVIPDPLISFESLRTSDAAADRRAGQLLRYKTARKLDLDPKDALFCMTKSTYKNGKFSMAFSVKRSSVKNMEDIFLSNGMVLSSATPAISCVLDKISDSSDLSGSAIFVSDGGYWTFALCQEQGVPEFIVSRWYEKGLDISGAFAEIERKLRAYAEAKSGIMMKRIYICCADGGMAEEAVKSARERFEAETVRIETPEVYSGITETKDMPFSVLLAAEIV